MRLLPFLVVEERSPRVMVLPSGAVYVNPQHRDIFRVAPGVQYDPYMPAWNVSRRWRWEKAKAPMRSGGPRW